MMDRVEAYTPDLSLKGKLRRRLARLAVRKPARLALERPLVSFTFDDAPATAAKVGAALLEARGLRGTYYVSAGLAGREGPMGRYATREETQGLIAAGHEIACHTYSHIDCGKGGKARILAEVDRNAEALADWGAPPLRHFAYPYGDVSIDAKQVLDRRFGTLRGLHKGLIEHGGDLNQAPSVGVEGADGEAIALRWLEEAARRKAWLILYTHDVAESPSAWGCTPKTLERLIDTALEGGFDIVTVDEGARRVGA